MIWFKKAKQTKPTIDRVFGYVSFAFLFLVLGLDWLAGILLLWACYEIGRLSVDLKRK